jgi:hypothetical protein|nr:MAG TPA: hypothetical protein [Caudoviricetes sp.]
MSIAKKLNEKLSRYILESYTVQDIKDAIKTKKDTWLGDCFITYPKDNKELEISFWSVDRKYAIKTTQDVSVISLVSDKNKVIDSEFVQDSDDTLENIVNSLVRRSPSNFNRDTIKLLFKWVKQ